MEVFSEGKKKPYLTELCVLLSRTSAADHAEHAELRVFTIQRGKMIAASNDTMPDNPFLLRLNAL